MKKTSRRPILLVMVAVALALFFIFWARSGALLVRTAASPIVGFFENLGQSTANLSLLENKKTIKEENIRLNELVRRLAIERSEFEILKQSYQELKALIGYDEKAGIPQIPAKIIGRAINPFEQAVFIDQGTQDGLALYAPVLAYEGILVGVVNQVWNNSALVLLINDKRSKIPAKVLGREGTLGVLEGHGVLYHLTMIPRDAIIEVGDAVITDALGSTIPAGLVIGAVTAIQKNEESPFQTLLVNSLVEFDELSFVSVLPPLYNPSL